MAQENIINIAIDSDSIVFKSCYRHQVDGGVDIEQAYLEFCYEIGKIRSAVFRLLQYQRGDIIKPLIVLSPKKTFRNDLSDDYKANRGPLLIHGIKQLKLMVMHRLPNWALVAPNIEADDVCIYYADVHNYLVSAIDKDVINACSTSCYNYNTRSWGTPNSPHDIEAWYIKQSLMGDTIDGIKGAPDVGKIRAQAFVDKYLGEPYSWSNYIDMFGDEALALQAMNLVRMDRLHNINGKLVHQPWEPFEHGNNYWEF